MTPNDENGPERRGSDRSPNNFYLDKRVPLVLLLTFLFQGFAFVWWGAKETAVLDDMVTWRHTQEQLMFGSSGLTERMTRVEEKQSAAQKSLDRIETILATPTAPPQPGRDRR